MECKNKQKNRKNRLVVVCLLILAGAALILGLVAANQNRSEIWEADSTGQEGEGNATLDLQ